MAISNDVSLTGIPGAVMNKRTWTDAICGFFPDRLVEEEEILRPV
jgi:hypothetical protein